MKQQLKHFWAQKNLIIGILAALLLVTTTALICSNDGHRGGRGYEGRHQMKGDMRGNMMMRGGYEQQGRDMMMDQKDSYMQGQMMQNQMPGQGQGTMVPAPATTTIQ
jgi:hypothetical protein